MKEFSKLSFSVGTQQSAPIATCKVGQVSTGPTLQTCMATCLVNRRQKTLHSVWHHTVQHPLPMATRYHVIWACSVSLAIDVQYFYQPSMSGLPSDPVSVLSQHGFCKEAYNTVESCYVQWSNLVVAELIPLGSTNNGR